jgi:hypothetical protein
VLLTRFLGLGRMIGRYANTKIAIEYLQANEGENEDSQPVS